MDSYQAIYNAVRSRISNGDVGRAVSEVAFRALDFSQIAVRAQERLYVVSNEMTRPSVLFRPQLSLDGNKYCALYGSNLMDGCAGFGDTAAEAMADFDARWNNTKAPQPAIRCARCGETFPDETDVNMIENDGCRDPDCPMQSRNR